LIEFFSQKQKFKYLCIYDEIVTAVLRGFA